MPRFRVDEFKLGHYHGPVHIAVHGGPRYHQDDAFRTLFARLAALRKRDASGEKRGAKSGDKNGYTGSNPKRFIRQAIENKAVKVRKW
jgi:hypothetical protein